MNTFYFEFKEHEYYALISVCVEKHDLKANPYKKAAEIYHQTIGGESVEQVLEEALPILIKKELAFMEFVKSPSNADMTVSQTIEEFYREENACLLIDSSLV